MNFRIVDLKTLLDRLNKIKLKLRISEKQEKIKLLDDLIKSENFWLNNENAQKILIEFSSLQDEVEKYSVIENKLHSLSELYSQIDKTDDDFKSLIEIELKEILDLINKLELLTFFSGEYDQSGAILSIHAGQGGTEACDWAQMLMRMYMMYANKRKWDVKIIDIIKGNEAGISKVSMEIDGEYAYGYLKYESGVHRLVRISPFNAQGLRQTSFAGVEVLPVINEDIKVCINPNDIDFFASKSGGPGGQNVNQVHSKVILIHRPTGIQVQCSSERSQQQNRELAMKMLRAKLYQLELNKRKEEEAKLKGEHKIFGWGNQIRNYVLHPYKLVKDLRTGVESTNPDKVLDGDLDEFINEEIKLNLI